MHFNGTVITQGSVNVIQCKARETGTIYCRQHTGNSVVFSYPVAVHDLMIYSIISTIECRNFCFFILTTFYHCTCTPQTKSIVYFLPTYSTGRLTRGLWSAYENGWIKGNCDTTVEILKKLLSFLKNFGIQRNIE